MVAGLQCSDAHCPSYTVVVCAGGAVSVRGRGRALRTSSISWMRPLSLSRNKPAKSLAAQAPQGSGAAPGCSSTAGLRCFAPAERVDGIGAVHTQHLTCFLPGAHHSRLVMVGPYEMVVRASAVNKGLQVFGAIPRRQHSIVATHLLSGANTFADRQAHSFSVRYFIFTSTARRACQDSARRGCGALQQTAPAETCGPRGSRTEPVRSFGGAWQSLPRRGQHRSC